MALQIPIGRVQSLPDSVEVRMPRNSCRTIQLLRLSGATGERNRCHRHDRADESIVQSITPLSERVRAGRHATEVRRIVDTALTGRARHLWIRTEWARSHYPFVHYAARQHGIRRLALLHPVDDRRHRVVPIGTDATAAVLVRSNNSCDAAIGLE
jgi:hypothetical protein